MEPIIEIKGVGKRYDINRQRGSYVAMRDVLTNIAKSPLRFLKQKAKAAVGLSSKEEFWALRDLTLTINKGDIVGIIGANGAGKSTLLKILTGITPPTEGEIRMTGRVASLLEVGTGFHPELTGRENIFLNGAILGMTKKEIVRKFDEIIAFAGIEKFLDTPVKYYSSGMYVRLAFSVAAHMEPDILLVDEVLAVGDAEFQKKCLGKMKKATQQSGRTILLVSHNMGAIEQLCNRCLYLEKGRIKEFSSDARAVVRTYLSKQIEGRVSGQWTNENNMFENEFYIPRKIELVDTHGSPLAMPASNTDDMILRITLDIKKAIPSLNIAYALHMENQDLLYWSSRTDQPESLWPKLEPGRCVLETSIPSHLLNEGSYTIELLGWLHMQRWLSETGRSPVIQFSIQGGLSQSPYWTNKRPGLLAPIIPWKRVQ